MADVKLPPAGVIEDYVWCLACGAPHEFRDGQVVVESEDTCESINEVYGTRVDRLPEDWDKTHHAFYADRREGGGYRLLPHVVDPLPDHRPMYYLEETDG